MIVAVSGRDHCTQSLRRGGFLTQRSTVLRFYMRVSVIFRHLTEEDMEEVEKYRKRELAEKKLREENTEEQKKPMNQSHVLTRQDRNGGAL